MSSPVHHVPRCSSCGAQIVWLRTASGRRMPVDAGTASPLDTVFDASKHTSHFASCPHADQHRNRRR